MRIFLDMDEVLVKFNEPAHKRLGIAIEPWPWPDGMFELPCYNEEFWANLDYDFWFHREPTDYADEIINMCKTLVEDDRIWVITSITPMTTGQDMIAKRAWMSLHYPWLLNRLIFVWNKSCVAYRSSVLIDDYWDNVQAFRNEGGHAILVPQPYNFLKKSDVMTHVRRQLFKLIEMGVLS